MGTGWRDQARTRLNEAELMAGLEGGWVAPGGEVGSRGPFGTRCWVQSTPWQSWPGWARGH